MSYRNPMCDGNGPCAAGEVRVLPTGGQSNAILCRSCYEFEMKFRRWRNAKYAKPRLATENRFSLPAWESLKPYA